MTFCTSTETCCTLKLYDDVTAILDFIDGFHPLLCISSSKRDASAKDTRVTTEAATHLCVLKCYIATKKKTNIISIIQKKNTELT